MGSRDRVSNSSFKLVDGGWSYGPHLWWPKWRAYWYSPIQLLHMRCWQGGIRRGTTSIHIEHERWLSSQLTRIPAAITTLNLSRRSKTQYSKSHAYLTKSSLVYLFWILANLHANPCQSEKYTLKRDCSAFLSLATRRAGGWSIWSIIAHA